ncbi:hypothetical protein ABZ477_03905 [Microbacterium sp. NPDC019599]|uniref:hypothetical protein n=1 Tax=Microbacterium sp. NPDC019599 TaxID=3154690 RepID=UPI0033E3AB9C
MAAAPDDAARGAAHGESTDAAAEKMARRNERNRQYRQAHPERHAAATRRWKEANPERVREMNRRWKRENRERSRELNRESMRRSAARKRRLADKRRRANEASRRWKEAHPEHVRTYHREWQAANRDKVNEYCRRYHAKHREELNARATAWRDSEPDKMKRARKAWADRNKERTAEIQRTRRSDPVKYRADLDANSAAKRLARRLERAGLPPKRLHRTAARERRSNSRAADGYFADPALPERLRQFTVFTVTMTDLVVEQGDRMLDFARSYTAARVRMGLPVVDPEDIMYARAAQAVADRMKRVDLLTGREIAAAVRSAKSALVTATREKQIRALIDAVEVHLARHRTRLDADADLENVARGRRGKPRLSQDLLLIRIALAEVLDKSTGTSLDPAVGSNVVQHAERALLVAERGRPRPDAVPARRHPERLPNSVER